MAFTYSDIVGYCILCSLLIVLVVFSFDIAKIHIKLKNNKENMKNYKVFLKLLPLQGALLIAIIPRAIALG